MDENEIQERLQAQEDELANLGYELRKLRSDLQYQTEIEKLTEARLLLFLKQLGEICSLKPVLTEWNKR